MRTLLRPPRQTLNYIVVMIVIFLQNKFEFFLILEILNLRSIVSSQDNQSSTKSDCRKIRLASEDRSPKKIRLTNISDERNNSLENCLKRKCNDKEVGKNCNDLISNFCTLSVLMHILISGFCTDRRQKASENYVAITQIF